MKTILIKRIYENPLKEDGYRILVDRLWPRGISKEKAQLDEWLKEIAPSNELRKWFGHQPELYEEFKVKYKEELKMKSTELEHIKSVANEEKVCLLFGAKDEERNQAVVIKEVLEAM